MKKQRAHYKKLNKLFLVPVLRGKQNKDKIQSCK